MIIREYRPEQDAAAAFQVMQEVGWFSEEPGLRPLLEELWATGPALVGELEGRAECLVISGDGTVRYLTEELPFAGILGVATSYVARRQGLASRVTARAVADAVARGALVCGLGMFEQGYYDRLGFGTGSYEHWMTCDPARLRVPAPSRPPVRLGPEQHEELHAACCRRRRGHGAVNFTGSGLIRVELGPPKDHFGLGFRDEASGELTHFLWCRAEQRERGPYFVKLLVYRTREQFLELMGVLASLGDQVHLVHLREPAGVQLQDLLEQPFKQHTITEGGKFAARNHAFAYWQMRICDLPGCLQHTRLPCTDTRFNLELSDPLPALLPADAPWRGCGGDWMLTLGPQSAAEPGRDPALPTLRASVGAFTRMWLGVQPASGLTLTDDLSAPEALLAELDEALRLPAPHPDWDF